MARKRKAAEDGDGTEAKGKLSRLLETESELDVLLEEVKREAAELVRAAKTHAEARMSGLQAELDAENDAVRARVEAERDEVIASIHDAAARETAELNALSDAKVGELARRVVQVLIEGDESGGRP